MKYIAVKEGYQMQKVYLRNQITDFISKKTLLTELIVLDCHQRLKHAGQRQTLTELRSRFWITKGKSYVQ